MTNETPEKDKWQVEHGLLSEIIGLHPSHLTLDELTGHQLRAYLVRP